MSNYTTVGRTRVSVSKLIGASSLSVLLLYGQSVPLLANPTGGAVVAGSATIGAAGKTLTINQSTNSAVINWQTFSIAGGETTKFLVPSSTSSTLNFVIGGNPSAIYGTLSSNGRLFLINPSGILVGSTGRIDTAGFLGSTLNPNASGTGTWQFSGSSTASIDNKGSISASSGNVYLIANQVSNEGSLTAAQGEVGLAAGSNVLLQSEGDQHLFVQANPLGTKRAVGVTNAGTIQAAKVELGAAGGNAYALAINNTGAISATGYKKVNGEVYLTADTGTISNSGSITARGTTSGGTVKLLSKTGTITNSGSIDASATAAGGIGGTVVLNSGSGRTVDSGAITAKGGVGGAGGTAEVSGGVLRFTGPVDLTAVDGKTGNLTLDPVTLTIVSGGSGSIMNDGNDSTSTTIDPSTVDSALATANITLTAETNITVSNALAWSSGTTLTLNTTGTSGTTININAPITAAAGGLAIVTGSASDPITTGANGNVNVASFTLLNGYWNQNSATLPTFTATTNFDLSGSSSFLRVTGGNGSANSPYQITDVYGLEGLSSPSKSFLTSDAELMNNINASVTANWGGGEGWTPIGYYDYSGSSDANTFSGTFNGQGFTISNLTYNIPSSSSGSGLFGDTATAATIENVNLTGVNVSGSVYVGGLAGVSNATITNSTSTGTVTGTAYVGGLLGINGGTLNEDSSSGTVNGNFEGTAIGGLVGESQYGDILNSSSSASVLGGANNSTTDVGGLVGANYASIGQSSASGTVTGEDLVGGLVGYNGGGTIAGSSSSSNVTGNLDVGGFAGQSSGGISASYSSGSSNGQTAVGGFIGVNITGTITNSYALGSATGGTAVGGFAGENFGTITNSYASGAVTGTTNEIGGLVGFNQSGTVIDSYTTSSVSANGATNVGGLVGNDVSGSYINAYWDTTTSGATLSIGSNSSNNTAGVFAATTSDLKSESYITSTGTGTPGWDFGSTWTTNGNTTFPELPATGGPGVTNTGSGSDVLSGIAYSSGQTGSPDVTVYLVFQGAVTGTTTTDNSGNFSFNLDPSDISTGLLLTDAHDSGNTYFQSNSSATSFVVNIEGGTLTIEAGTASNAALKTTISGVSPSFGVNFAVSNSNALTTNPGVGLDITSNYTIDGNMTAAGKFIVSGSLSGATAATLQGTSVSFNNASLNVTAPLTVTATSGEVYLQGVGNAETPAVVDGLTLNAAGPVSIQGSYLTLPSGNFSATGTGYASTSDSNGDPDGIDLYNSSIVLSGGNLTLNGTAGYDSLSEGQVTSGAGVSIANDGETQAALSTTGSGSITIKGTVNNSGNPSLTFQGLVNGVNISGDGSASLTNTVSVENGNIAITGTVTGTTANGTGVNAASIGGVGIEEGAQVVATGSGDVTIIGNTAGATTKLNGGNFSSIYGVEVQGQAGVTSGTLTITGTAGTLNTSNSTINASSEGNDGTGSIPLSVGVIFDTGDGENNENVLSGAGSTVNITGTGGAVVTTGAYTGVSIGVLFNSTSGADFGTAPTLGSPSLVEDITSDVASGSAVTISGTGGAVNAGNGSNSKDATSTGVHIAGALTVEDGGSLAVTGTGGGMNISNATAASGDKFPITQGIRISGGAVVSGIGSASLTFTGTGGAVTTTTNRSVGSFGLNIGDDNGSLSTLSVANGVLTLTGTAGTTPNGGVGVVFHGLNGGQVQVSASPVEGNEEDVSVNTQAGMQIQITGTGSSGYTGSGTFSGNSIPNAGVALAGNVTVNGPSICISGAGGSQSDGVMLVNLGTDATLDSAGVSPVLTGGSISLESTVGGMYLNGGINASSQLTITSAGDVITEDSGFTGGFSTQGLELDAADAILINNAISGNGTMNVVSGDPNVTLGANASLSDTGNGNVLTIAAGTSASNAGYFVNDSSLGANALSVSDGAVYYIYSLGPQGDVYNGLTVASSNVVFGASLPSSVSSGNGQFYFTGAGGTVPTPPPVDINLLGLASQMDGSGSDLVPVSIVPQNGQVQGGQPGGNEGSTPSFSFGNSSNQNGGSGGLASSSGNGGLIGSGDAATLGGGAVSNFQNPAAYSALDTALGFGVHSALSEALAALGDWSDPDYNPADNTPSGPGGNGETEIGSGDVVVIGQNGVQSIPLGQAPPQLQQALGNKVRGSLSGP